MSESERSAYAARVFMPPIRLKLTRLSRGTYRWEIEVNGDTAQQVLDSITKLDNELRRRYAPGAQPVQSEGPYERMERAVEGVRAAKPEVTVEEVLRTLPKPKELVEYVKVEDAGTHIIITPRQYLGSENFAKVANVIKTLGGEYISAGKDSYFSIPKVSDSK